MILHPQPATRWAGKRHPDPNMEQIKVLQVCWRLGCGSFSGSTPPTEGSCNLWPSIGASIFMFVGWTMSLHASVLTLLPKTTVLLVQYAQTFSVSWLMWVCLKIGCTKVPENLVIAIRYHHFHIKWLNSQRVQVGPTVSWCVNPFNLVISCYI